MPRCRGRGRCPGRAGDKPLTMRPRRAAAPAVGSRHHPLVRDVGRGVAVRRVAVGAILSFSNDNAASPSSDRITGGKQSATTLAACARLAIFRMQSGPRPGGSTGGR